MPDDPYGTRTIDLKTGILAIVRVDTADNTAELYPTLEQLARLLAASLHADDMQLVLELLQNEARASELRKKLRKQSE